MPVDPRLFAGANLGEIFMNAQRHRMDMERQRFLMDRQAAEDDRAGASRKALGAYLLTGQQGFGGSETLPPPTDRTQLGNAGVGGSPGQPNASPTIPPPTVGGLMDQAQSAGLTQGPQGMGTLSQLMAPASPAAKPVGGPGHNPRSGAYADLIRADPATALATRRAELTDAVSQLEVIGRLAGSAVDENTYQNALRQARGMGLDTSNLPPNFDPNTVRQLQREALTASQQFTAELQTLRLSNDIEDDAADNERADAALEDLSGYRSRRLDQFDEAEGGRNARHRDREGRLSQPGAGGSVTPSSVIGAIMAKQARGEPLTPAEQETLDGHRNPSRGRRGRAGRPGGAIGQAFDIAGQVRGQTSQGRGSGYAAPDNAARAVNPATGRTVVLRGRVWVDEETGRPIPPSRGR